jgi:hypothetical protein
VFERARRAAKAEGVTLSTWLRQAAEEAAGLAEARAALAEYIQVYGPPDEDAMADTRTRLDKAGIGDLATLASAADYPVRLLTL